MVDSGSAGADETDGRDGETEMSLRSSARTFKTAGGARLKVSSSRSLAVSADLPVLRRSPTSGGANATSSGDSDISGRETCEEREGGWGDGRPQLGVTTADFTEGRIFYLELTRKRFNVAKVRKKSEKN